MWQVRTVSGRATLTYRMPDGDIEKHSEGPAPDYSLRPIPGLADADDTSEGIGTFRAELVEA